MTAAGEEDGSLFLPDHFCDHLFDTTYGFAIIADE